MAKESRVMTCSKWSGQPENKPGSRRRCYAPTQLSGRYWFNARNDVTAVLLHILSSFYTENPKETKLHIMSKHILIDVMPAMWIFNVAFKFSD